MPFNCDVCGEEVGYDEPVFKLRNGANLCICMICVKKSMKESRRKKAGGL